MARATVPVAGAHAHLICGETDLAQSTCERTIRRGGPDGKNAVWAQRGFGGPETVMTIQTVVGSACQPVRAVVDIKQNRIIRGLLRSDECTDVTDLNIDARIVECTVMEFRQRSTTPFDHSRDEFGDDDMGILRVNRPGFTGE